MTTTRLGAKAWVPPGLFQVQPPAHKEARMARTVEEALENFARRLRVVSFAFTRREREKLYRVWERKMHPGIFELQMDMRRDARKERKNMALLRMIGGLLTILFWFFVLLGIVAVIGLMVFSPFVASIILVCILVGCVNAFYRMRREGD